MSLYFEDIEIGDEAPAFSTDPLTRTNFVKYAGASGDFNPMHHDETYAQKAGRPSVFGHGMYTAGVLSRALTEWVGLTNLRKLTCRFVAQVWPDDILTVKQVVTDKAKSEDGNTISIDLTVENQNGEKVLTGKAVAAVGSRA